MKYLLVMLLLAAVLTTTAGAASAADSEIACQRFDTGTVDGVTVTGIAASDGDCVVASNETLAVTFEPSTLAATLGFDAFVVVDRDSDATDGVLVNLAVRHLGNDRYRVDIPHDSLAAVNEPGDDIRLQIEIRTVTVLQTDRSDAFLVHLDADVDSDGISDREEGIDDADGDGTSDFRDPTDGTVETPTPTSTLT